MPPAPTLQTILIERLNPAVALFWYNQPQISNAFTVQQYLDMRDALVWARDEPELKVVVQTGKGKHYCAGKVLQSPDEGGPTIEQEIEAGGALGAIIQTFPKILIAAVNGAAIGWGCTQLFNFDLVYTSRRAIFQTPFMSLGFVPEGGSSYTFPKVMGKQHANRLLIGAEKVSAREMYVSGLVTQVVDAEDEAFVREVCEIAKRIGGFSGASLRVVKELTNREEELEERRRAGTREGKALKVALNSPEAKRVMADFAARSKSKGKSKM